MRKAALFVSAPGALGAACSGALERAFYAFGELVPLDSCGGDLLKILVIVHNVRVFRPIKGV